MQPLDGGLGLGGLSRLVDAQSRSISAENPTGEKGKGAMAAPEPGGPARELGLGWKCRPCIAIPPGATATLAEIDGPGIIQSMWFAGRLGRDMILRIHWDGQAKASVETPINDFFAMPWVHQDSHGNKGPLFTVNSLPVTVNPNRGLSCYWEMPFHKSCRMTLENRHPTASGTCFYQINYCLGKPPAEAALFHAQFRRVNPLPYKDVYTIVDNARGRGHYVGTAMGWGVNNNNWWGEGEIKFYIDGDSAFPTICGTGTEDYFCGAYNWEIDGQYVPYSTPFSGMHEVLRPDGTYRSQHRHAMYRWHIMDPVRFAENLKVTMQALGWRSEGRFLPGQHDICSVAYWYQTLPTADFPPLPDRDALEVV